MMRLLLSSRYIVIMAAGIVYLLLSSKPGVCEQDPDRQAKSLAAYTMGTVYDQQGAMEQAVAEYQKSAAYQDNYAVHLRLGTDYARMGNLEEAISEFEKVLKFDKENVQARYLLALVYSSQKNYDKAADNYEAILKTAAKEQPENVEIYGYLGQLYYAKKEYDQAIIQFEKVLLFQPDNSDLMYVLGSLYLEKNERTKAKEIFSRCIDHKPDQDGCLNSLGYMLAEDKTDLKDAKNYVERALAVDSDNPAYLDSLGWIYSQMGNYDKALEVLLQADAQMKDPVIYDHLGDVYSQLKEIEKAKKYWKLSLELLPGQSAVEEKLKSAKSQ